MYVFVKRLANLSVRTYSLKAASFFPKIKFLIFGRIVKLMIRLVYLFSPNNLFCQKYNRPFPFSATATVNSKKPLNTQQLRRKYPFL